MYQNEARKRREKIAEKLADGQLLLSFGGNDELGVVGIQKIMDPLLCTESDIWQRCTNIDRTGCFVKSLHRRKGQNV